MPDNPDELTSSNQRQRALSRWDNEGGAIRPDPQAYATSDQENYEYPPLTNAELVHLRIRVIALENLVIALLAEARIVRRILRGNGGLHRSEARIYPASPDSSRG